MDCRAAPISQAPSSPLVAAQHAIVARADRMASCETSGSRKKTNQATIRRNFIVANARRVEWFMRYIDLAFFTCCFAWRNSELSRNQIKSQKEFQKSIICTRDGINCGRLRNSWQKNKKACAKVLRGAGLVGVSCKTLLHAESFVSNLGIELLVNMK